MQASLKRTLARLPGFRPAYLAYRQYADRFGPPVRALSAERERPRLLMLETSAHCNLRCPKCSHSLSPRPRGFMDLKLALSALDQAREMGVRKVVLSQGGEPLLHPGLETIVAAAAERGLYPYFVTNGTLLDPERSRGLIDAGLKNINVSFDAWDDASYQERQTGGDLGRVLDNLRRFRELRGNRHHPRMYSVTVLDSRSLPRAGDIIRLIAPRVDACYFVPLTDFGFPGRRIDRERLLGERSWLRSPCLQLWENLTVGWDGRVTGCCNDQGYDLAYADLNRQGLREVWASPTLREWRRLHLERRYGDMPLCGLCTIDYQKSFDFARICYRLHRLVRKELNSRPSE